MFKSIAAAVVVLLASCLPAGAAEPLRVVASFPILADIAAQVGGEHVSVSSLVPIGGEPHGWSPRPQDVRKLAHADLVVVNGLGLEGWLDRLVAASGYEGPIVVASRDVKPILDESGLADPHAWHSPGNVAAYAAVIAEALVERSPAIASAIEGRLAAFQSRLSEMSDWAQSMIAAVPADRRVLVTTHDAFAYLAQDTGIRILSPVGLDSAAQPSAKRLAALVTEIREARVGAVFPEDGSDDRLARTLADETGVALGAPLYAGTLSGPDGPAPDYLSMWRYNVTQILRAMTRE